MGFGLAETIGEKCVATVSIAAGASLALFILSIVLIHLEYAFQKYFLIPRKLSKIPISGPITLRNGRKPNLADLLAIKVHMADYEAKHSNKCRDNCKLDITEGRMGLTGLACPICREDLNGNSNNNNIDDERNKVMVVAGCFHVCHTECFNNKVRDKNACPSCDRAVEAKDIKEVRISSKFYNSEGKSCSQL